MRLYRLATWICGRRLYATGTERIQFVPRRGGARLYTRRQADQLRKRFRKVRTRLELEPVPGEARAPAIDLSANTPAER